MGFLCYNPAIVDEQGTISALVYNRLLRAFAIEITAEGKIKYLENLGDTISD